MNFVRGFVWKARMYNGAVFELWTPYDNLTRAEARRQLLDIADVYLSTDIDRLWRTKGPR